MENEDFCRFFMYSLLDNTISEIRFDAHLDELDKSKIWALTNFIINIPLKLLDTLKNDRSYFELLKEYEEYSKRLEINKWFNDLKESNYEHFLKIQSVSTDKSTNPALEEE